MMIWLLLLLISSSRGLAPEVVLEMPFRAPQPEVMGWLEAWCARSEVVHNAQMPLCARAGLRGVELRFTVMPEEGLDCVVESPGGEAPFGRLVVSRVSAGGGDQASHLARDAADKVVGHLRRDAEHLCCAPRMKEELDPNLYRGDYGPEFAKSALDLIEIPEPDDHVRQMFAKGEELAKRAAEERGESTELFDAPTPTFPVSLRGLEGGIDIFAGPPPRPEEQREAVDESPAWARGNNRAASPPSPEMRAKFNVLVRELDCENRDLVLDAYRDVLLDDSFAFLIKETLDRDPSLAETLEIMNKRAIELATLLAEMAATAEKQHLETIQLVCEAAKEGRASDALKDLRVRFDSDFVAYLSHAIQNESPHSDFRMVLEGVRNTVYSELAKDYSYEIDVFDTVLNLKDQEVRTLVLAQNWDNMGPNTRAKFLRTARNIFDNLLVAKRQSVRDTYWLARLVQLREDLLTTVCPEEAKDYLLTDTPPDDPLMDAARPFWSPATTAQFGPDDDDDFGAPNAPSVLEIPGTATHVPKSRPR